MARAPSEYAQVEAPGTREAREAVDLAIRNVQRDDSDVRHFHWAREGDLVDLVGHEVPSKGSRVENPLPLVLAAASGGGSPIAVHGGELHQSRALASSSSPATPSDLRVVGGGRAPIETLSSFDPIPLSRLRGETEEAGGRERLASSRGEEEASEPRCLR